MPLDADQPVHPQPDDKDWTWTLSKRCEDCGLSAGTVELDEVTDRLVVAAAEWVQILISSPAVAARPAPTVWSPLEYAAHVRDVLRLFDARFELMLLEEDPTFANWDQDETARTSGYADEDPDRVAEELAAAAAALIARLRTVTPADLGRRATRSNGSEFTVRTLSQYLLHDVVHHLWDVTGQDGVESLVG